MLDAKALDEALPGVEIVDVDTLEATKDAVVPLDRFGVEVGVLTSVVVLVPGLDVLLLTLANDPVLDEGPVLILEATTVLVIAGVELVAGSVVNPVVEDDELVAELDEPVDAARVPAGDVEELVKLDAVENGGILPEVAKIVEVVVNDKGPTEVGAPDVVSVLVTVILVATVLVNADVEIVVELAVETDEDGEETKIVERTELVVDVDGSTELDTTDDEEASVEVVELTNVIELVEVAKLAGVSVTVVTVEAADVGSSLVELVEDVVGVGRSVVEVEEATKVELEGLVRLADVVEFDMSVVEIDVVVENGVEFVDVIVSNVREVKAVEVVEVVNVNALEVMLETSGPYRLNKESKLVIFSPPQKLSGNAGSSHEKKQSVFPGSAYVSSMTGWLVEQAHMSALTAAYP